MYLQAVSMATATRAGMVSSKQLQTGSQSSGNTNQGCQMVCFQTKNPNLGKFWSVLQWKMLVYLMSIWSILRPLELFYGHLVYFVIIWYIFSRFGMLCQEKCGNPVTNYQGAHPCMT
jgi:hypothetical protein